MNIDRLLSENFGRRSAFSKYVRSEANDQWLSTVDGDQCPTTNFSVEGDESGRGEKMISNRRKPRTTFSIDQTDILEMEYGRNEYIHRSKRIRVANQLNLSESQIKIWFQNRRAKDKRIEKANYHSMPIMNKDDFHGGLELKTLVDRLRNRYPDHTSSILENSTNQIPTQIEQRIAEECGI